MTGRIPAANGLGFLCVPGGRSNLHRMAIFYVVQKNGSVMGSIKQENSTVIAVETKFFRKGILIAFLFTHKISIGLA